jgi:hypothetical protein
MTKEITDAESLLQHVDKSMHILRTAAFAVQEQASLNGPCTSFAECLNEYMVTARDTLENCMLTSHDIQLNRAMLPALDFATERQKLTPFEVSLPTKVAHGTQNASSVRQKSISALAGVPPPPVLGENPSAWCAWLWGLMSSHSQSWSNTMLLLHHVEQHFFTCTERYLSSSALMGTSSNGVSCTAALSAADISSSVDLLEVYSQVVAKVEDWPGLWQSDAHKPMLKVQLRSLEALLTWIVLCLIYQRIEIKEWEGIRKYKLPVEPDALRHLVRGGNAAAQRALTVVAEYVCRIGDRSNGRVCFSLNAADTLGCVVDYAGALLLPVGASEMRDVKCLK